MMTSNTQASETALDSGRRLGEAVERTGERARELRQSVQTLASRGMHSVADRASAAQRQLGEYTHATGRYVAEHPLKSALIAAAIGAGVAALVMAWRHRRQQSTFY